MLADSPSVPFHPFSHLFSLPSLFIFIHLYFPPHLRLRLLGLFLVCSDPSFIGTISKRLIYSRLFPESSDLLSRPFQLLYSLGFNSPNDWFYTWRTTFISIRREEEKVKDKIFFENNENIKCLITKLALISLNRVFLYKLDFYSIMF